MADRGLDPAGPILAVLFGAKSSDLVVDVVTGSGVRVDWSLNDRQNYSNSTRIREYRVRVAAALNALSDSQRLAALTSISRGLVGRKIGDADALNTALESTGWRLTDAGLVGTVHATPFDQPVKGVSASQLPTAVIVTALELEAVAAREHLREIGEQVHENGTVYFVGLFGDENPWQVAIVTAGAGNPTAALELERAIQSFKPSVVLLVGVAGGIKDVALGDVVAADKVYGYERGKVLSEFLPRPEVWRSTYAAVQRARAEVAKDEWQRRIIDPSPTHLPRAFVAPIAAGEKVVAAHDSEVFAFLRKSFSDAIAVEMEGAGFLAAAHANIRVNALVVRGISDLIEGKASADANFGQLRAARHAAAFAFQVLSALQGDSSGAQRGSDDFRADSRSELTRESMPPGAGNAPLRDDLLSGMASATVANTAALERIENALNVTASLTQAQAVPRDLVDAEVERRLTRLRKTRFLQGGAPDEQASRLTRELLSGDLQFASASCKARALAWCSRILFDWPDRGSAKTLVHTASLLARNVEVSIAEAFSTFHDGDLAGALAQLSTLDSPMTRSAAFIMVRKAKGPREALAWLEESGLGIETLDADGKFFVIVAQLDSGYVERALQSTFTLGEEDFEQTPALLYVAANASLSSVIPVEVASSVLSQPAATLVSLPLADGVTALEQRRQAMRLYRRASQVAGEISCPAAASEASDRALWLAVRDPQTRSEAMAELQASMRSPEQSVRRLPIALEARVKIDLDAAEQEIDRQTTLSGGGTETTALARLAIAKGKAPAECALYLQKHRDELAKHLNPGYLAGIEIGALVASGQLSKAEERFQEVLKGSVSEEDRDRLERIIADARESDPSGARERRFAATNHLADLLALIGVLEENKDWARLAKYGQLLFERVRDLSSCIVYAQSLFRLGSFERLVDFLRQQQLLGESDTLRAFLAWSLYSIGDMNGCRAVLSDLRASRDVSEDRDLVVNLGITSGDWSSLAGFVEQEWEHRESRDARELLRAASLAHSLGSARVRALVTEAATRSPDDPHVLIGCYTAAMSEGWEDESTFRWLERAATLSPPDGPVQRVSLKDLVDRNPGWQRRQSQAWKQLNLGQIPLVGFGVMLNRSLAEVSLLLALGNSDSVDPRRRTLIFSYSGVRRPNQLAPKSLAVDPTALLNLEFIGLLRDVFTAFAKIVIPHGTLPWLFEEAQRIRISQPSRTADANEIKRLLASKILQRLDPTAPVDEALASEIGHDLACLFAEAEADWGADQRPRYVVRPGPIHRAGSLMQEEADLGAHAMRLCGCLDVVDALANQGRLTQAEEKRARAFLKLHETQNAVAKPIAAGAVLYLDGVSLAHLQHLRLLPKFDSTGFTVVIAADDVVDADRRIAYESLIGRATMALENIREILRDGIAAGTVVLAPRVDDKANDPEDLLHHPALDVIRAAALADAVVVDDRYLNRHSTITHDGVTVPILTTYDLCNTLQLPQDERAERIARMRTAGFAFVPVTSDELAELVAGASVRDGQLVETAELRALRENLQMCRMSIGLQLPDESPWLDGLLRVLFDAIKGQWGEPSGLEEARARSSWLLHQLDVRGWAHRYANDTNRGISQLRFRAQLQALLFFNRDVLQPVREAYWEWLEEALVDTVRELQGDLYEALVKDLARLVTSVVERQQSGDSSVGAS